MTKALVFSIVGVQLLSSADFGIVEKRQTQQKLFIHLILVLNFKKVQTSNTTGT